MDKTYNHLDTEERIYKQWETSGAFQPTDNPHSPSYSIVLPPPNANADLHIGHAMYVVEDILIRYHRMKGDNTLWVAGADHAGIETQFVFEKHLAKQGKSRFDFSREELYQQIFDFVMENKGKMENQLRRLGFSLDWSRNIFTLDPDVIKIVYKTFKHLHDDGLIYRGERLVNYCTRCGTSFSDLEVNHVDRTDPFIYMKYGPFTIGTVRPETKFRDTALAVNPSDERYKSWIGKTLTIQGLLGPTQMTVIPDPHVKPEFGTGIMKVTPAHDEHDFELGKQFNLPVTPIITKRGRMDFSWFLEKKDIEEKYRMRAEQYHGKKIAEMRTLMLEHLKEDGLLVKVDENYTHSVGVCYKCGRVIEPMLMPQWFVKVRSLADKAIEFGKKGKIRIFPKSKQKIFYEWLEKFHDWNISRQIVWGIRIPAWKCLDCSSSGKPMTDREVALEEKDESPRLRSDNKEDWIVTDGEKPEKCSQCHGKNLEQDTDTFDTWFSSGQWPFATLHATGNETDFKRFYPLSLMETGYDILPAWVVRMAMLGIFETGQAPFKHVFLHGLVRDAKGQKMSKSKGNVVNPLDIVEKYGADALRFALMFGSASGADVPFSEDKARGMRNFANKLWNIGRFILMHIEKQSTEIPFYEDTLEKRAQLHQDDQTILTELNQLILSVTQKIESYQFNEAADQLYEFTWHRFADWYLEAIKSRLQSEQTKEVFQLVSILRHIYIQLLKLLHPFMPFVTEEIWSKLPRMKSGMLIVSSWPQPIPDPST